VTDGDGRPDPVRRVCLFARSWHGGLGDLVPVNLFLQVLRQAYPGAEITHMVGEETASRHPEFFARHSCADRIVRCPNQCDDDSIREFLTRVRAAGYDVAVFDPFSQRLVARYMAECGVRIRIGFASGGPDEKYLTSAISIRPGRDPEDFLGLVQALAGAVGVAAPSPEAAVPWFRFAAQPLPVLPSPVVAMHPGGAPHWNRRWPLARFGELGRRLAAGKGEVGGASLVLLGSAEEAGDLAGLAGLAGAGAVVQVCAGEPLDTVASWLASAEVLVSNESALAHIAAALGTPAVVLCGPADEEFTWERLYRRQRTVQRNAICQPYREGPPVGDKVPCAHSCHYPYVSAAGPYPRCMTEIDVAEVDALVREMLPRRTERGASARG
jgi:ADP-heptose:LPS heptosyltransferase